MNSVPQVHSPQSTKAPFLKRLRLWLSRGGKVSALISHPEPQAIGSYARGRQLMAGNFKFAGLLVESPGTSIWDIAPPSDDFAMALHRFAWIDDLAAVGGQEANTLARTWALQWIQRYGLGRGPGWTPSATGRRLIHLLGHVPIIMAGIGTRDQQVLFRSLSRQAAFLERDWPKSGRGLPRIEALTGLIYAGLSLEGLGLLRRRAAEAMAESLSDDVDNEGGLPNRNPEDLLEVFTLLGWVLSALREVGEPLPDPIWAAMERIAPTLRALRHVNGHLARFHGGGAGRDGQLDKALVTSELRLPATTSQAMGFATLHHGRLSMIVDAACPPKGRASARAHASTLAFELTSGGHPLIVNCGAGRDFGPDWAQACRATASHSTLSLEQFSSSRIGDPVILRGQTIRPIVQSPKKVMQQKSANRRGSALTLSHDGYLPTQGLTHMRRLMMTVDGREVHGEDSLRALSRRDKSMFTRAFDATGLQGIPLQIRFHLHPDTEASIDLGGRAISIALRNGEVWVFRTEHTAPLTLEPSVYMDPARLKPRATKQIVLSDQMVGYALSIDWRLTKAQEGSALSSGLADRRLGTIS